MNVSHQPYWLIDFNCFTNSHLFFVAEMEVQVAGTEEERNALMPTAYVDTHRDKAELESEIK